MASVPDPRWLADWLRDGLETAAALRLFDGLPPVAPDEMAGRWRGRSCPTGHPLDGLLESLGWYGKAFLPPDRAHPLLFRGAAGRLVAIDPALLPLRLVLRHPGLFRSGAARAALPAARAALATQRPAARLLLASHRGVESAAMAYERQPVVDHFRRIDADRLLGVMEMRGVPPFFFLLRRDAAGRDGRPA